MRGGFVGAVDIHRQRIDAGELDHGIALAQPLGRLDRARDRALMRPLMAASSSMKKLAVEPLPRQCRHRRRHT
jgi:hypothetical protein